MLSQEQLDRALFPLGDSHKSDVRRIARRLDLPVHDKPGSQDLCFLPRDDYREFLRRAEPGMFEPGKIVHVTGRTLGEHDGIADYTVGQRRGLGVAHTEPLYVIRLRAEDNTVVVGERRHAMSRAVLLTDVSLPSRFPVGEAVPVTARIRYNHRGAPGRITPIGDGRARLEFEEPVFAPAPGQAAVFYRGDTVLGGGTIQQTTKMEVCQNA
jgi:tRNA-specific 2-thiouridylase